MQPIHSGTTTERIVRSAIPALLVTGFAGAFLWDGYVGYPRDNAAQLARTLGVTSAPAMIDWNLSKDAAQAVISELAVGTPIEKLDRALDAPGLTHGDERYYLGPTGHVRMRQGGGVVTEIKWVDGVHSTTDLIVQRWLGYVLLPVALGLLLYLIRVATTRTSLTDDGLRLGRKPIIPLDAVKGLRVDPTSKGEVVEITYDTGDGKEKVARLDAYLVKQFTGMVAALCEGTGQPNPLSDAGRTGADEAPETDRTSE